ncbi:type II secretion system protein [Fictibacillus iocasae]|uniref:Type II secretion system protein n=1 Tax=Fictibacillus iocasae TaxID=2715437 RepID=A0ABW2NWK7_9BACL
MLNLLKKHLKNEKGLTLIELLVVIVILGIIAAIAVVSIGNIIDNTKEKAKVTEAVQIINAAKLARAAEGSVPASGWVSTAAANPLSNYLDNVKDNTWTVGWSKAGGYTITGHDSATIVSSSNTANTAVLEKDLTDFID